MQVGITKLPVPRFSDSKSTCTLYDIFLPLYRNQIFGLDISICFDVLDSNVGLTPSVFKNGTSDYTYQKYSKNNRKHALICNKNIFATEQKRHVENLRSWIIITGFSSEIHSCIFLELPQQWNFENYIICFI